MSSYKESNKFKNFTNEQDKNNIRKEPTKFRNFNITEELDKNTAKKEPNKFRSFSFFREQNKNTNRKEPTKFRNFNINYEQNKNSTKKEPNKFRNFNITQEQNKNRTTKKPLKSINNNDINLNDNFYNNKLNINNLFNINTGSNNNLIFDDDDNNYVIGSIIYKIDNFNDLNTDLINEFCNNRNKTLDNDTKENNKYKLIYNNNKKISNNHEQLMKDLDNLWLYCTIDLDFWNEICTEYLSENYFYEDFLEIVTINKYSKKILKDELSKLKKNIDDHIDNHLKKKNFEKILILKKKIITFYLQNYP